MSIYRVRDWNKHFENNKSRARGACSFVCVPNKQHGLGFARIMSEPDGAAIYGIWICILGACSQQQKPREGWLTDTGRAPDGHQAGTAWAPSDLALKFRRPLPEIERALDVLKSPAIGWLECIEETGLQELTESARVVPGECPPDTLEEKRNEENRSEVNDAPRAGSTLTDSRPIEAPAGMPTIEQALSFAKENAIKAECAEKWFWTHDAENWQDRFGRPLANWRSSLRGYWKTWAENDRRDVTKGQRGPRVQPGTTNFEKF